MGKNTLKLTESQLRKMIIEAIDNVMEENQNIVSYYRGCSVKEAKGRFKKNVLWLTPQASYAKEYLQDPTDVIIEYKVNENHLNPVTPYEMDEIYGEEVDIFDDIPNDLKKELLGEGYNCYMFDTNDGEVLCLFNNKPIVSKRILSREEIESI